MKKVIGLVAVFVFIWTLPAHATGGDDSSMVSLQMLLKPMPDRLEVELVAINQTDQEIKLQFPTSKIYDFSIYNTKNKEIYRFSDKRFFLQALQDITLKKDEKRVWKSSWDYTDHGQKLKEGSFYIKAVLLPSKINGKPTMKRIMTEQEFFIPIIENLEMKYKGDQLLVTGKLNAASSDYYYTVDDGHNILVKATPLELLKKHNEFAITVEAPKAQNESFILTIYNSHHDPVFVENILKK